MSDRREVSQRGSGVQQGHSNAMVIDASPHTVARSITHIRGDMEPPPTVPHSARNDGAPLGEVRLPVPGPLAPDRGPGPAAPPAYLPPHRGPHTCDSCRSLKSHSPDSFVIFTAVRSAVVLTRCEVSVHRCPASMSVFRPILNTRCGNSCSRSCSSKRYGVAEKPSSSCREPGGCSHWSGGSASGGGAGPPSRRPPPPART
ncbi:MAG: hypothetical protein WDW36_005250 [Sanguina aurantia]